MSADIRGSHKDQASLNTLRPSVPMFRGPSKSLLGHIKHFTSKANLNTMAKANIVQLNAGIKPQYYREGISPASTTTANELLQENHDTHHIFFNMDGFHNHISHHLLTIWALKASPESIKKAYEHNRTYQRPLAPSKDTIVEGLHDKEKFARYLGPESHYSTWLHFFQSEIDSTSWQEVLQKYVFAGDDRADDMLVRLYAGLLHPIIHLGFGVEFEQPAIIAEALAEAACHQNWIGKFLLDAEKAASQRGDGEKDVPIAQLLQEIHADEHLSNATPWSVGNKIRDGVMKNAGDRMIHYASMVKVRPEDLERKCAEMTNAAAYFTAGSQRKDKAVKFDFYFMHDVNCSVFYPAFLKQDWLSAPNKARMLEWKIRMDLVMYASRHSPNILLDEIRNYKPQKPSGWDKIEDRVCVLQDDGHASKLIRALANGQRVCEGRDSDPAFMLNHDDWLQVAHMTIDSVEGPGDMWIRSAGFDEAWENVPARAQL